MPTVAELIAEVNRNSRTPFIGKNDTVRNAEIKGLAQSIKCLSLDDILLVDALIDKSFKSRSNVGIMVVNLLLQSLPELPESFIPTAFDAALSDISLAEDFSPQTIDLLVSRTSFDHVTWLLIETLNSKDGWRQPCASRCILFLLGLLNDPDARPRKCNPRLEGFLMEVVEMGCKFETALVILRDAMPISPSTYQTVRKSVKKHKSPLLLMLLAAKANERADFLEQASRLCECSQTMTLVRRVNGIDKIYSLRTGFYNIGPYAPKDYDLAWKISNEEAFSLFREAQKSSILTDLIHAIHRRSSEKEMPLGYVET